jgi:crotonobetainyl-CoA:carnitine CoA-transferase CaiB-like acyl-CoA transferase
VVDYRNMLKSEQARINGYLLELDHPVAGKVLISGQPVTINGEIPSQAEMPPEHGQHTEEILLEAGYSWEDIGRLRETGAV